MWAAGCGPLRNRADRTCPVCAKADQIPHEPRELGVSLWSIMAAL